MAYCFTYLEKIQIYTNELLMDTDSDSSSLNLENYELFKLKMPMQNTNASLFLIS